jgi:thiamine-monophosphate kinase
MNEFDIIARHFRPLAGLAGLRLEDDAAALAPPPGDDLIVTTDAIVAGVHFFPDDPPDSIGRKALAVNLSDLAAKGARPLGFQLTVMLPAATDGDWLSAFARGLGALAAEAGCPLTGGDTVSTPGPLAVSITAFGSTPRGRMTPRGGAAAGDRIVVTGCIGDGAVGLVARAAERAGRHLPLTHDHLAYLVDRYLRPRARFAVAQCVRRHARAAMDVSDGFVGDLTKMLVLAGHGADVKLDDVPLSVAVRAAIRFDPELEEKALTGGDDYEIIAAVPEENVGDFQSECLRAGVPAAVVGVVGAPDAPIRFLDVNGRERRFRQGSYEHRAGA